MDIRIVVPINTFIPMAASIKKIINVVVLIVTGLWLLQVFGVIGSVGGIRLN